MVRNWCFKKIYQSWIQRRNKQARNRAEGSGVLKYLLVELIAELVARLVVELVAELVAELVTELIAELVFKNKV